MAKPYLDINGQIQNLTEAKGLIINDIPFARQKPSDISYLSLIGGYKVPFFNGISHKYVPGSTFEDIVALYEFDKSLRLLTFGYITSVEEKLRQKIVDAFCGRFGELQSAFLNPANYRSEPSYSHSHTVSGLVNKFLKSAVSDKDHAYVIHQRNHYHNVPLWTVVKVVTFGTLSKMYSVLQYPQRIQIARSFLYPSDRQLEKAVDCMTYFRNICAHNERLYSFKLNQRSFMYRDPEITLTKCMKPYCHVRCLCV